MHIPSPQSLGIPDRFDSWRPTQVKMLQISRTSEKRVIAMESPTGSGKSLFVVADSIMADEPTCINTNSRGLQDQYMEFFQPIGMADIRGKKNYECQMKPDYSCEEGSLGKCPYRGTTQCPCSQAEMRAAVSKLVITNYSKWTSSKRYGTGMQHFTRLIMDEGHESIEALCNAMNQIISVKEIEEVLKLTPPSSLDVMDNWKEWAILARPIAEGEYNQARERINCVDAKQSWIRHFIHCRNLVKKITTIAGCRSKNWVVDTHESGWQFDPIRPGMYSESTLLLRVPKIIILSATLRPKTLHMLGIPKEQFEFHEFPSDFDTTRCPIYYMPVMRVDRRAQSLSPLWTVLEQWMARRRDRKGIIHTISYDRAHTLVKTSRFSSSMILDKRGESSTSVIERFKRSGPGAILVSPAVSAGYDFPLTDCEWQVIIKVPFPDGRSKIVKARQADDPEWGPYQAAQDMDQMAGRGMREQKDQCETIIFDAHFGDWFFPKHRHLFSKFFKSRLFPVQYLPEPPRSLYDTG